VVHERLAGAGAGSGTLKPILNFRAAWSRVTTFAIIYRWNLWINAAITRTGTPVSSARKWRLPIARSAWTPAGPAPTPASTANFAKAASSGNSAAKRPGSGVRRRLLLANFFAFYYEAIFAKYLKNSSMDKPTDIQQGNIIFLTLC